MSKERKKSKVFLAMSGGVDSSVAALLLLKQGYDVTGVHMRCWSGMAEECARRDREDARDVADALGIPFLMWNLEKEYKQKVIEYMIEGYRRGITPNPDVMCNKEIKFGIFLAQALKAGADFVATGHYVRLRRTTVTTRGNDDSKKTQKPKLDSRWSLFVARDPNKDQSYFLWTLTQKQLAHCLFPIGEYTKPEVRELARIYKLPTAEKKDSQGICFMGPITLHEFLEQYIPYQKGKVLTTAGAIVGEHKGINFYTIGQRHGLNLHDKRLATSEKGSTRAHYIAEKDAATNTIIVAEEEDHPALQRTKVDIRDINFIRPLPMRPSKCALRVLARVRYRQLLQDAMLLFSHSRELKMGRAILVFKEPVKFVASGQSAVCYLKNGELLGGGVIV